MLELAGLGMGSIGWGLVRDSRIAGRAPGWCIWELVDLSLFARVLVDAFWKHAGRALRHDVNCIMEAWGGFHATWIRESRGW